MRYSSLVVVLAITVTGCGSTFDKIMPDRKVEYKKSAQAQNNLEIPPDLTRSSISDELVIPDLPGGSSATLSKFNTKEQMRGRTSAKGNVLLGVSDIEVQRDGDQYWLRVKGAPEEVWYKTTAFWQENGILLTLQDPNVGVMQTDWLENQADISTDFITETFRSVWDGLYSASTRDQYRVRIEEGEVAGTTDLFLTHRGMQEFIIQDGEGGVERTVFNPRPSDPGLEAEMLRRLMIYMGVTDGDARTELAAVGAARAPRSELVKGDDTIALQINEAFSKAWRMTGIALDRVGFAVEDRDRGKGVYFVRYSDPMEDQKEKGWMDKLNFWSSDDNVDKVSQYRVRLTEAGEQTQVVVLDEQGQRQNTETATRILTLLNEQIR